MKNISHPSPCICSFECHIVIQLFVAYSQCTSTNFNTKYRCSKDGIFSGVIGIFVLGVHQILPPALAFLADWTKCSSGKMFSQIVGFGVFQYSCCACRLFIIRDTRNSFRIKKRTRSRNLAFWTKKRNSQFWTKFGRKMAN